MSCDMKASTDGARLRKQIVLTRCVQPLQKIYNIQDIILSDSKI